MRHSRVASHLGALLVGVVLGVVGLYLFYRPVLWMFATSPYNRAASMGKLYVKVLDSLRQGDERKGIETLEFVLDGEVMTLSTYEANVPVNMRDPRVYEAAAIIRQYRQRFPSPGSWQPEQRQLLQRGLDLGTKANPRAANGP